MLTEMHKAALNQMAGNGLTSHPIDNARAVVIIKAAEAMGDKSYGLQLVQARRASFRTWVSVQQRRWQRECRTESRARHHDSVSIREGYVRCKP